MTNLSNVLTQLAGIPVRWVPLRDVGTWYGGGTPSKSVPEYWENGDIPWLSPKDMTLARLTATADHVAPKALEKSTVGLVPSPSVAFVVRSNVLRRRFPIALVPFAATLNQDMRAVVPHDGIVAEYLAHVCRARADEILAVAGRADGSMAAIQSGAFLDFKVPVPPVTAQRAIVTVLDRYSALQAELDAGLRAELEARGRQYQCCRDSLLGFSVETVDWRPLGELALIGTGSRNTNEAVSNGRYPFFVRSQEPLAIDQYEFDEQAVLTAGDGVGVGKVFHFVEGRYALHQRAYRIRPTSARLHPKFLFHFIRNDFKRYLATTQVHASVTSLRKPMFERYLVPLLPLEKQARIVDILDKLDALQNEFSTFIPAELNARRQQYEYYRDKLLTFEHAVA